jgi:hypothetical protein
MKMPLILVEGGSDVTLFESERALLEYVEGYDVKCGIYEVFDSTGRCFELTALSNQEVELTAPAAPIDRSKDLQDILTGLLSRIDVGSSETQQRDLDDLVARVASRLGVERESRRWPWRR